MFHVINFNFLKNPGLKCHVCAVSDPNRIEQNRKQKRIKLEIEQDRAGNSIEKPEIEQNIILEIEKDLTGNRTVWNWKRIGQNRKQNKIELEIVQDRTGNIIGQTRKQNKIKPEIKQDLHQEQNQIDPEKTEQNRKQKGIEVEI